MKILIPYYDEIQNIKNEIVKKFNPDKIILFGSCAKGMATSKSDIDICVIKETDNKRQLLQEILIQVVDYEIDVDVVVYTPEEWNRHKDDTACFANIISRTGVVLYG